MTSATPPAAPSAAEPPNDEFAPPLVNGGSDADAFGVSPCAALAAIAAHDGPVFVDLDETLYLRNSTEDFIDLARPALLAVFLLRILDVARPWRWSGGEATRDVWRVQLVRWFFPWTIGRWRSHVARLAENFANAPLLQALNALPKPPIIVTVGFRPIVVPLVAALGLADVKIVASRPHVFEDRRRGKLLCSLDALGEHTVRRALLLTDSPSDLPLLRYCDRGLLAVWPDAIYRPAFAGVYFPGRYIDQIKRPGEHYLRRAVLQEDYLLWVLTSIALSSSPIRHVAGLLLLLASFWTIYELGYVDNDRIAARFEHQPALTQAFHDRSVATPIWQPWIWAIAFAIAGIFVIRSPALPSVRDFLAWSIGLLGTAIWFAIYNRSDKRSRVWMYLGLQFSRTAVFALIVPVLPVGAMALAAHTVTRWIPYYIYRLVGRSWPLSAHFGIARLLVFLILAVLLAISSGWSTLINWSTFALVLWNLVRARRELFAAISGYSRIDSSNHKAGRKQ
jgi:hypothetical protein